MSKAKVAPTLSEWVGGQTGKVWPAEDPSASQMRRELRALLAVARAARRVGAEWNRWDEARPETCARLYRALSRLDALSKGRGAR